MSLKHADKPVHAAKICSGMSLFFFNCRIKLCLGPMSVCVGVVRRISYLCGNVEDEGMVIDSPHTG